MGIVGNEAEETSYPIPCCVWFCTLFLRKCHWTILLENTHRYKAIGSLQGLEETWRSESICEVEDKYAVQWAKKHWAISTLVGSRPDVNKPARLRTAQLPDPQAGSAVSGFRRPQLLRETGSALALRYANHRVPEKAGAEVSGEESGGRVVHVKMTTLVLDNGAYHAKIGYSHENVS